VGSKAKSVPGGIGEKPPDKYKPINKEDIDWSSVYEPEDTDDPNYNFLATCGQTEKERQLNPDFRRCHQIWEENYDMVTPIENATLVQNHYNEVIKPLNPGAKVWLKRSIYNHFQKNRPSHGVIRQSWLDGTQKAISFILNTQLYRLNTETGLEEMDIKFVKPLTTLIKEGRSLLHECSRINATY
jgi:hypothetical protein